jgi:hypothetical protein
MSTIASRARHALGIRLLLSGAEAESLRDVCVELEDALKSASRRLPPPDPLLVALGECAAAAIRVWLHQDTESLRFGLRDATSAK